MRTRVREIWEEVLGVPVDEESDFFELGGHSLLGTQMLARVDKELGVMVPLRVLFEQSALKDFTDALEEYLRESG